MKYNMKEFWNNIDGYSGYKISSKGRVLSNKQLREKLISTQIKKDGYVSVKLYKNGKAKRHPIHRLVAKAFIPNPENKPEVNHIDSIKSNNFVSNLEWCTRSENMIHADRNGRLSNKNCYNNPASKFKRHDVLDIMSIHFHGWCTQKELADAYNVSASTIQRLIKRNKKKYA